VHIFGARCALQSIRSCCSALDVTASGRPHGIGYPFRVLGPLTYDPYCLGHPTLPLTFSSAVWFSVNGVRLVTVQHPVESSLRVSPPI
jgi:hypothetical protein